MHDQQNTSMSKSRPSLRLLATSDSTYCLVCCISQCQGRRRGGWFIFPVGVLVMVFGHGAASWFAPSVYGGLPIGQAPSPLIRIYEKPSGLRGSYCALHLHPHSRCAAGKTSASTSPLSCDSLLHHVQSFVLAHDSSLLLTGP
jgi:hypothetical protein